MFLFLNVTLPVKPGAFVLVCFLQSNFKFVFHFHNPRLFYLMVTGIGMFNRLATAGFSGITFDLFFSAGICSCLFSILPIHQVKLLFEFYGFFVPVRTPVKENMFTFAPANYEELYMYQFHIFGSGFLYERKLAIENIHLTDRLPPEELIQHRKTEKMHVLPGRFETCGRPTLGAAAMYYSQVITNKGFIYKYFNDCAFIVTIRILLQSRSDDKGNRCNVFEKKVVIGYKRRMPQLKTKLTKNIINLKSKT